MKRWLHRVAAALMLPWICLLLWTADICIRVAGLGRSYRLFRATSPTPASGAQLAPAQLRYCCKLVRIAHRVARVSCLRRSLVIWWLLRWRGGNPEICMSMGVDRGHAWVELHGTVLGDQPILAGTGTFQPFSLLFGP